MPAKKKTTNGAALGFEQTLWLAADKLRGFMDPAEYKHVVLGLIFLKYISDAFEDLHTRLVAQQAEGADAEDPDEYRAEGVFWVPPAARWGYLQANAKQPTIGRLLDDAMTAIEQVNPSLKGVLPKDYARPTLDKQRLGGLIDLIGTIGLGDKENRSRDILGRVYEYFLSQFASSEGKKGGEFYTPRSIVQLLVEMLAPYKGRVYDPCCGSGGMFVQSEKFAEAHGSRIGDISVYGQESNPTTWRMAKMNLAIRGIENNLGAEPSDSFRRDLHPDLKADFVIANPPFNISDWGGEILKEDKRWKFGTPPTSNANFAWVQHFIHHLAPDGLAGFVLAISSLDSESLAENEIRKNIIESDLVDCIVALPGKLFYSTPIPVCLWFISRNKAASLFRNHKGETLFIDASQLSKEENRTHSFLTDTDISKISSTYHSWKSKSGSYGDVDGFCRTVRTEEIRQFGYSLFPARYVKIDYKEDVVTLSDFTTKINANLSQYSMLLSSLMQAIEEVKKQTDLLMPNNTIKKPTRLITVPLSEILDCSDERLGNMEEPEILRLIFD